MKVNENGKVWKDFLAFSSRFYFVSFSDSITLYEKHPDYTVLTTFEQWNKVKRRIKYGSNAVKIGEYNYFDISQTEGEDFKTWEFNEGYINNFIAKLKSIKFCDVAITENKKMELALSDLIHAALNRNDSISGLIKYGGVSEVITDTAAYMTYKRLGMDEQAEQINFDYIYSVNDKMLMAIGKTAFDYAHLLIRNAKFVVQHTIPQVYEEDNTIVNDFEVDDVVVEAQSVAVELPQKQTETSENVDVNYIAEDYDDTEDNEQAEQESVSQDTNDTTIELVSEDECVVDDTADTFEGAIVDDSVQKPVVFKQLVVDEKTKTAQFVERLSNKTHVVSFTNQVLYDKFSKLFPEIINGDYRYLRCESDGFEPLIIEDISIGYNGTHYSIVHYYEQNGDLMRDPEITFKIDRENKSITATSYQMDSLGLYEDFSVHRGKADCESFFVQWLTNIENQHYKYVRAIASKEQDDDNEIIFDIDLDTAKKEITEFIEHNADEHIEVGNFNDLENVHFMRTEVTDLKIPVNLYADLINFKIKYFLGDKDELIEDGYIQEHLDGLFAKTDEYSSLVSMATAIANYSADDISVYEMSSNSLFNYLTKVALYNYTPQGIDENEYFYRMETWREKADYSDEIICAVWVNEHADRYVGTAKIHGGEFDAKAVNNNKAYMFEYTTRPTQEQVVADLNVKIKAIKAEQASEKSEKEENIINGIDVVKVLNDEIFIGTSVEGGKSRIYDYYINNSPSDKEFADFIKREFGIGGRSSHDYFQQISLSWDTKGLLLYFYSDSTKYLYSWSEVAKATATMIDNGTYLSEADIAKIEQQAHDNGTAELVSYSKSYSTSVTLSKVGDFYEMYDDDAQIGANVLGLVLTRKGERQMVGFPAHALDDYTAKLRNNGIDVLQEETTYIGASAEQAEQIELPAGLPERIQEHYNRIYDAMNNVEGYYEALDIGDEYIKNNGDFVGQLAKVRGDLISSDREVAALAFALADYGLIPNFVEQNETKEEISNNDDVIRNNITAFVSDFGLSADDFLEIYNSYGDIKFKPSKYDTLALSKLEDTADVEILKIYYGVSSDIQAKALLHDALYSYITERKGEQKQEKAQAPAVTLMSDSTEVADAYSRQDYQLEEYTMTFSSDDQTALMNVKDIALSLGEMCTTDTVNNKLIVHTFEDNYNTLLLAAYENDIENIETMDSRNNLIIDGYEPNKVRYAIIHNDNSEYEMIDGVYNGRKATHNAHDYPYNVQKWISTDNGFTFIYAGYGEFCKTLDDAKAFAEKAKNVDRQIAELDLKVGDAVYLQDVRYTVEKIDENNDVIDLLDTRGYPITRVEKLSVALDWIEKEQTQETLIETIKAELPQNFHIEDDNLSMAGGAKEKFKKNVAAIKTLKLIESENRSATHDEMVTLSQYVGWGGIPDAFDDRNSSWSDEYAQLKDLLTEEEYEQANAGVLNEHYTQPIIIKAMYKAIKQFGLDGGKILEPCAAIGNFIGCMPVDMESKSKLTAVELDSLSGRICRQLYPRANVQITGFETAQLKENSFDVAIGNVPFGNYSVVDRKYNRSNALIHDYFILKSLDMVRPNGIVAFITSSGTMDKKSSKIREMISEKAELVGAIRLPNTAFKANALTDVVTDILFLQKRAVPKVVDRSWLDTSEYIDDNATYAWERNTGLFYNKYFEEHPEMICGKIKKTTAQFGYALTVEPFEDKTLEQALNDCIDKLASDIVVAYEPEYTVITNKDGEDELAVVQEGEAIPALVGMRENDMVVHNNKIYKRKGQVMVEQIELSQDKNFSLYCDAINLANKARATLLLQSTDISDEQYDEKRKELFDVYTDYVKKHGNIKGNSRKANLVTKLKFNEVSLLAALENVENGVITPSDILTKRTIHYRHTITHCDTIADAYQVSLAQKGKIDLEFISSLADKSIDECIADLNGVLMFRDPQALKDEKEITEGWISADEYLSGNIREKLSVATAYAMAHKELEINVAALEKNLPERIKASDISCQIGSSWIPEKYLSDFIEEIFDISNVKVEHNIRTSNWSIANKDRADYREITRVEYGTGDKNALEILENLLNLRETKVYKEVLGADGETHRVVDKPKTEACANKAEKIKDKFKVWIYQDAERTRDLENIYNEKYNSERNRHFDGSHLTFEGMADNIELQEHQKNAIARVLYGGSTLLAHCVGAGKTYEMAASAMEMRRIGLATKPLFVVPNHLVGQWGQEFYKLYPNAHILLATNKDFEKDRRKEFVARIATGDYDAVIMAYSTFQKIDITPEKRAQYYRHEIEELRDIIDDERSNGRKITVKNAQTRINALVKLLDELEFKSKDEEIYFEQLGVDALFVDEAHNFKNLSINTKLSNISGISNSKAKRASDMLLKIECIKERNGGDDRNVVFATGTPISNSITEMYVMQKYLQSNYLADKGLMAFDSWLADFAEISTQIELSPTGTSWRSKTRCNTFKNLPELMTMFKHCTDVQTAQMLNLPIPKLKNGQPTICLTQPSDAQKAYIQDCGDRADLIHTGSVDPSIDNMLKVTNDGKMCALDFRLIDPQAPDMPNSKVNCCVYNVFKKWEETKEDRLAQVIFLDRSTPSKDFNLYDDIKQKLIGKGVPEEEIAFIHDAGSNDAKKLAMFKKVNKGEIRIILGSTEKLGAGTNMQDKLVALHHLDVPWRPADIEQREGRILRRGNTCEEVEIFRYATEGTFDSYSWQTIENKQKFISQVMTDKPMGRSIDDVDEQALSYAEIKSLASGDERIKEQLELSTEVTKLKSLRGQFLSEQIAARDKLTFTLPQRIEKEKEHIENIEKDLEFIKSNPKPAKFNATLLGGQFTDREKAAQCIRNLRDAHKNSEFELGAYRGFGLKLKYYFHDLVEGSWQIHVHRNATEFTTLGTGLNDVFDNIDYAIDNGFAESLISHQDKLTALEKDLEYSKELVERKFEREDELNEKMARLEKLTDELMLNDRSDNSGLYLDDIKVKDKGKKDTSDDYDDDDLDLTEQNNGVKR